jgi:tetratricopeptide (TPR) repeat protein
LSQTSFAQDDIKLADYYYNKGEFDKAETYYEKLYKKYQTKSFFEKYFDCLMFQEKYDEAEKLALKQIKRDKYDISYQFYLADVYEATNQNEKANAIYNELINELPPIQSRIQNLGKLFVERNKYDFALKTYLKGKKMVKGGYQFNLELADLYAMQNNPKKMIQEYLDLLEYSSTYRGIIQNYLARNIDFEEDTEKVEILKEELLTRIQKHPNKTEYNELLIWLYLQKKEFKGAVIQAKALDKRIDNTGRKVFEIGNVCKTNQDYENARDAYKYVINLGPSKPYYSAAIQNNLEVGFLELTEKSNYNKTALQSIANDYENALAELGKNRETIEIIERLAQIYAFYLDQPQKAENLIKDALNIPITPLQKAQLKVLLADVYIVNDKIWDASILYMQVANDFSEEPLGHEAKFKNAKVFYYDGEFEYAKAQLDVLKASTTKLIANDAMQLSLLIQDNLGIDTTTAPLMMYAKADLLLQQNKFNQALSMLDSIESKYPFHSLVDEIIFKKGEIYEKMQQWDKAVEYYEIVSSSYAFDILGDDATYKIAKIYDYNIGDKEKAAEYYKKILFEFQSSLYTADSRKRYREIKGT